MVLGKKYGKTWESLFVEIFIFSIFFLECSESYAKEHSVHDWSSSESGELRSSVAALFAWLRLASLIQGVVGFFAVGHFAVKTKVSFG